MEKDERVLRYVSNHNAYMTYDGLLFRDGGSLTTKTGYYYDATARYTTVLPEGIQFGYSKMQFLPTGLYINGWCDGFDPLTMDDVVMILEPDKVQTSMEGTKVKYTLTGQTLGGNDVDPQKSYRPIVEMKDPNRQTLFNLSYPASKFSGDSKYCSDGSPGHLYMFLRGQLETPEKYISEISLGTFSSNGGHHDGICPRRKITAKSLYKVITPACNIKIPL